MIPRVHNFGDLIFLKVATKNLALQLVKLRQQIAKLQKTRGQIVGMTTHTQVQSDICSITLCQSIHAGFCLILFYSYLIYFRLCLQAVLWFLLWRVRIR